MNAKRPCLLAEPANILRSGYHRRDQMGRNCTHRAPARGRL